MMEEVVSFGQYLKDKLQITGISRRALALRLGHTSSDKVIKWEQEGLSPSPEESLQVFWIFRQIENQSPEPGHAEVISTAFDKNRFAVVGVKSGEGVG